MHGEESLGACGLRQGNVAGSYLHLIDRAISGTGIDRLMDHKDE